MKWELGTPSSKTLATAFNGEHDVLSRKLSTLQIDEEEHLTLIDFPQMVSVGHGNARELFYRDVECVIR